MQINPQPGQKGGKLQPSTKQGWGAQGKAARGELSPPDLTPTPAFSEEPPASHLSLFQFSWKNEELKANSQEMKSQPLVLRREEAPSLCAPPSLHPRTLHPS